MKSSSPDENTPTPDWLGLAGARVLVAGAGGIGTAVANGFLQAGCDVTVVDRDRSSFSQLSAVSDFDPDSDRAVVADLLDADVPEKIVRDMVSRGPIDVLVHCIGVNDRRPILEMSDDDWRRIIDINLLTAFRIGTAVGRRMVHQQSGHIVFFSSVAGQMAHRNHGPYAASKGGLNQMMRVMASEWATDGVRVNAIAPGYVETPLTADHLAGPNVRQELERLIPVGRLGTVEQLVGPALFLSSKHSEFITGQVLYVDGGRTLI